MESLRSVLRHRTRALHARLDASLTGPEGRVPDVTAYERVVRVLHSMHALADRPLAGWARTSPLAAGLDGQLLPDRAGAYAADLEVLGVAPEPSVPRHPLTAPVPDARGLALLYVVAGSSIGARVVLRGLPDAVPAAARSGLTDAAGPSSVALWRQARAVLTGPVADGLREAAAAEARQVFEELLDRPELLAS